MLRLSMKAEEYLQIGENIRIAFLGGSRSHIRVIVDAPADMRVVRSTVMEKSGEKDMPRFHRITTNHGEKRVYAAGEAQAAEA